MSEKCLLIKNRCERYAVRSDVVETKEIEPSTLRMRTAKEP